MAASPVTGSAPPLAPLPPQQSGLPLAYRAAAHRPARLRALRRRARRAQASGVTRASAVRRYRTPRRLTSSELSKSSLTFDRTVAQTYSGASEPALASPESSPLPDRPHPPSHAPGASASREPAAVRPPPKHAARRIPPAHPTT